MIARELYLFYNQQENFCAPHAERDLHPLGSPASPRRPPASPAMRSECTPQRLISPKTQLGPNVMDLRRCEE